jgi:hypothetical protein
MQIINQAVTNTLCVVTIFFVLFFIKPTVYQKCTFAADEQGNPLHFFFLKTPNVTTSLTTELCDVEAKK